MIPDRLERSHLYVPASNWAMIGKAAVSAADAVVIDLEDAVAQGDKAASRANVIRAFRELDFGPRLRVYRINGLDTGFAYRDLTEVLEAVGDRLDLVMLPKAGSARDVHFVETLLAGIEAACGYERPIGIEALIETAAGVLNVREVAAASPRLEALIFGSGDFAASAGMPLENIGERGRYDAGYPGDRWHHATQSVVLAARAHGLRCLDGPFAALGDPAGLAAAATSAHGLGFGGKQCIHPAQLAAVNAEFSPSEQEVARARAILSALEQARQAGRGAVTLDGRMIDAANLRLARSTLEQQALIDRRTTG